MVAYKQFECAALARHRVVSRVVTFGAMDRLHAVPNSDVVVVLLCCLVVWCVVVSVITFSYFW